MYVFVCGGGLNDVVCVMMQLHLSCRGVAPRCLLYGGDWWMSQSECVRGSFFSLVVVAASLWAGAAGI